MCPSLPTAAECPLEADNLCLHDNECPSGAKCCKEYCNLVCVTGRHHIYVLLTSFDRSYKHYQPEEDINLIDIADKQLFRILVR